MKTVTDVKTLTDLEIVDIIIKTQNTQYFGELYDRYITKVLNKCIGFSNSIEEAEDLAQDVFILAYTKINTFKVQISFRQWLFVLTYNFCVNYVNRNTNKKIEKNSVELNDSNELLIEVDDNSLFQLREKQLEKALNIIKPDDKIILLLKYQDDLSIKDIANAMDLNESAIKMRLKRAKSRLVQAYNKL